MKDTNSTKIALFFMAIIMAFSCNATEIWVGNHGNDTNLGTKESPLATLNMAIRKARELRRLNDPSIKDGIHIILMDGIFYLDEPVFIRPEDSGTPESPTIIEAEFNAKPILNGGVQINGWKKYEGNIHGLKAGTVWVADAPKKAGKIIDYRQLWVNGKKAIRAKSTSGTKMERILSWDKNSETCWIPFKDKSIVFQPGMEMFIVQWWAIANLRIKDIMVKGDSAKVSFLQPESRIQSEHPWPAPWISKNNGNSAFFLNNGMSMLNEPGEWYLNHDNGKIYYYPRAGEDINSVKVMAPVLENLLEIKGNADFPVKHISFKGISFEYANWLRPSQNGHVPLQTGMYLLDAYKLKIPGTLDKASLENQAWVGRPRAAVEVNFANNLKFEACNFQHLASTGLDLNKGTNHNTIIGNLFKDIGGTAINVGVFSDESFEAHLPYNPKDERDVCSNEVITDNLITNVANEDWGTVGIAAGFVKNITIAHNEISDVSYTGISLGWGWTPSSSVMRNNKITANKIHHYAKHLHDVAGIYTLSSQPNSSIEENYINNVYHSPYAHDPYLWLYLYTDEGSSFFSVKNNWIPVEKILKNNNGPGNVWEHNSPYVDEAIKKNAGIRNPYKYLENEVVIDKNWQLQELPENAVIELVGTDFDMAAIAKLVKSFRIINQGFYQWENHLVIYGKMNSVEKLKNRLALLCPQAEVKSYQNPVYNFTKFERCENSKPAQEWDDFILTANLVADEKLQQAYLDHHKTQFQKWPEVAQGFCNANFQQLQVFKNGRQLMLVISVPKGASLDELNPKTTENNPRVIEWNALMKKYQTGIEGTKPNETWVFFNKLDPN
ncbi:right-handed parallel beta-helix repeat-containing protein [Mariniflexile maritimum]|uniref:right-handed parallel beta-helix repeat-containing protein n=1 Tax=Mariniflexile maritimum TaxID=2682493 RepID=UPI0012F69CA5|nr:right-handed parallel beta-helix repeat-containing protein [Mariniflexile maritimum]